MSDPVTLLPYLKLHLNVNCPTVEECYVHGYESALAEIDESENPYPVGTRSHEHWQEGWWAGFYGDAPCFDLNDLNAHEENAANDQAFQENSESFFIKLLEISGMIVVSAFVGYQLIELVA